MAENNLETFVSTKLKEAIDNDFTCFDIPLTSGVELYLDTEHLTALRKKA